MQRGVLSGLITLCLTSSTVWGLPFKCDKDQSLCEVQNKRLTVGDQVGVFTEDGQLAAVGSVVEIRGVSRIVKIDRKWGQLYRTYDMQILEDEKAKNPEQFFRVITPLPKWLLAANIGLLNISVGDGFFGNSLEGGVYWRWKRETSILAKLHYISASGEASDNLGSSAGGLKSELGSFGLTVGLSEVYMPFSPVSLRVDGELGVTNASVHVSGGFDEGQVLNNRIVDGSGLFARLGASVIWRREGFEPEVGFNFFRIQDATGYGLSIGVTKAI